MPNPNQASLDFLSGKTSVPSAMVTADWARFDAEIRERAFFMAAVEDAEILSRFRGHVEAVARGEQSMSEAKVLLHDYLKARGYEPLPGQEGTIKDLRSLRRMTVALETNVEAARSYGQWKRQQAALAAFPATRFKRGRQAKVPRDWPARWRDAIAEEGQPGATQGRDENDLVALANHGLWTNPKFNELGSPWTPFAFGSGMITQPVSRAEAKALGLLPTQAKDDPSAEAIHHRSMLEPQDRGFNETLQARPDVAEPSLREALADRLKGFARWEGDTLVFTDPNGTRPGNIAQVVTWITAPLPESFPSRQRDAALAFIEDPGKFILKSDRDRYSDFARLIARVSAPAHRARLWREIAGLRAGGAPLSKWLRALIDQPAWEIITDSRAPLVARLTALLSSLIA